jgi:capsular polysaccharide biosynthesis protein
MELKEYLAIFKKNFKLFIIIVGLFVAAGILFQFFRPLSYEAILNLNITRTGKQETGDYRYDSFYRLQADERFADTVVRWLGTPSVSEKVFQKSGISAGEIGAKSLSKFFSARRMSSQLVTVEYSARDIQTVKIFAASIAEVINSEAEKLNEDQREESWFKVVASEPIIRQNVVSWQNILLFSLLAGIFAGFWAVLIRHYIS